MPRDFSAMSFKKLTPVGNLPRNMAHTQTKEKAAVPAPKGKTAD
jgi:hypothetical protein